MDSSKLAAAGSSWHQFACSSVHWSSRHDPDLRDSNTFETPACRAYRLLFVMIALFPISHRNGYAIDQESTSRIATLRDSAEIKKQLPSSHIRAIWSWSSVGIWVCLKMGYIQNRNVHGEHDNKLLDLGFSSFLRKSCLFLGKYLKSYAGLFPYLLWIYGALYQQTAPGSSFICSNLPHMCYWIGFSCWVCFGTKSHWQSLCLPRHQRQKLGKLPQWTTQKLWLGGTQLWRHHSISGSGVDAN